ncbi:MAG TPA: hypothetical protein VLF63_03365 [Patescibacteria group bacterium]|nr:hypothetical protein [Patescibacteria group bacterium]
MSEKNSLNLLQQKNKDLDFQTKASLKQKIETLSKKELPKSNSYFINNILIDINNQLKNIDLDSGKVNISRPTQINENTKSVDLAFNISALESGQIFQLKS